MRSGIAVLLTLLSVPISAEAASCDNYPVSVRASLKPRIDALRLIEREAADRLIGLDTRPFDYLVGQARSAADALGEPKALADEDTLDRCRDPVPRVRRVCRTAALALANLLAEQAAGAASVTSQQAYSLAMGLCEAHMGLTPLRTAFRTAN